MILILRLYKLLLVHQITTKCKSMQTVLQNISKYQNVNIQTICQGKARERWFGIVNALAQGGPDRSVKASSWSSVQPERVLLMFN